MELNVIGSKPVQVSEAVFGKDFRQDLVHQVVVAYRNAGRSGTKAQLTRSEVNGTTKKSKNQKGGGARHGALKAPIFVGGGVVCAWSRTSASTSQRPRRWSPSSLSLRQVVAAFWLPKVRQLLCIRQQATSPMCTWWKLRPSIQSVWLVPTMC